MTAKELRQAAENVLGIVNDPPGWTAKIIDSKRLASHVLATVRDDDDEPVTEEWLGTVKPSRPFITHVGPDVIDAHYCHNGTYYWGFSTKHLWEMTRGQFRSLCRGLGIVLEEKTC